MAADCTSKKAETEVKINRGRHSGHKKPTCYFTQPHISIKSSDKIASQTIAGYFRDQAIWITEVAGHDPKLNTNDDLQFSGYDPNAMTESFIPIPAWELPDDKLLALCRVEAFVGSGPGGQHRNRINTAIRITHGSSGISTIAQDSRSQRENRIHALRHLRHKLALLTRRDIDLDDFHPPDYLREYPGLHMSEKNPLYPKTVALILDVLKSSKWNLAHTAIRLGCNTTALLRFIHSDPAIWVYVQDHLKQLGLKPLRYQRR